MKFTFRGKHYKWNFERSIFFPIAIVGMTLCLFLLGGAMCSIWNEPTVYEVETVEATTVEEPVDVSEPQYIGEFTITYYCCEQYPHICNAGEPYLTATGTTPTAGRTIAVDPDVIPYGTELIIDGQTYIAEDCGGAINGNRIDIVVETHEEALNKGIHTAEVYKKEKRDE